MGTQLAEVHVAARIGERRPFAPRRRSDRGSAAWRAPALALEARALSRGWRTPHRSRARTRGSPPPATQRPNAGRGGDAEAPARLTRPDRSHDRVFEFGDLRLGRREGVAERGDRPLQVDGFLAARGTGLDVQLDASGLRGRRDTEGELGKRLAHRPRSSQEFLLFVRLADLDQRRAKPGLDGPEGDAV